MAVVRASLILVSLSVITVLAQQPSPVLWTTTVDVDGAMLRVRSSFARGTTVHGPVVVFETGAGIPLETWDKVLVHVAAFAPVVAYDRPGTGKSAWNGEQLTPQHANQRLKKLLETMGVPAPIVLVGHSWGGALARYFAGEHPQLVKAILYIDPTDVTMTEPMWQQMFASFGATTKDLDAFFAVMDTSTRDLPPAVRAESMMMMQLLRTKTVDERGLKPAPDVPASVLLAGRIMPLPKGMVPFDGEAYARALQDARVSALPAWVKGKGRFLVVEGAGHFVYRDAPDVIVAEIERLMNGAPAR
jgi:pimeloyl-ACP methyl ester carboxylesterase